MYGNKDNTNYSMLITMVNFGAKLGKLVQGLNKNIVMLILSITDSYPFFRFY